MVWKVVVKLGGNLSQLGQPAPWDVWEVVVLVVVSNVVAEDVQRPVVAVRFRLANENVVLGDEVGGYRVQRPGQEATGEQVDDWPEPEFVPYKKVERELDDKVQQRLVVKDLVPDGHRPTGVEQDLRGAEEQLS